MTQPRRVPDFDHLEHVIEVLERGDWRTAVMGLAAGGDAGQHEAVSGVLFCLRCVSRSMHLQCALGDVERAADELERAARRLVQLGPAGAAVRRGPLPLLPEPVRDELPLLHLVWATTRLVLREMADLIAVRMIFGNIGRGRRELIYAYIEHLTHVEFDPWTARVHPRDQELLGLDDDAYARFRTGNALDISARATNLRHYAAVRSGSVVRRTWHRMGGYPAVRETALLVLANEAVTRGRTDCPVRLGRLRAWEYAQRFRDDTAA